MSKLIHSIKSVLDKSMDKGTILGCVQTIENRTTKTGAQYQLLKITDGESSINVFLFDLDKNPTITIGAVYGFKGTAYGKTDIAWSVNAESCTEMYKTIEEVPDNVMPEKNKIVVGYKNNIEEIKETILKSIEIFGGKEGFKVLLNILLESKVLEKMSIHPAANKHHHAAKGGLLYHTFGMLKIWYALRGAELEQFKECDNIAMTIGIIMHDFGKIMEYSELGEVTQDGTLLGHMYFSAQYLQKVMDKIDRTVLDSFDRKRLIHIILSHHGKYEWGSPVVPATKEALLVHYIDMIDAKSNMMDTATEGERVYTLENASIVKL